MRWQYGVAMGAAYGALVAGVWLGMAAAAGWARGGRRRWADEGPPRTGWRGVVAAVALAAALLAWLLVRRQW